MQNGPKLNSRPVYCSRLYGIYNDFDYELTVLIYILWQGDNIDMLSLSDGNNGTISNDHTLPLHLNDGTDKFEDTPIVQKNFLSN